MGLIDSPLALLGRIRAARAAEDVHDFLGVVEIDPVPEMGVLVLPNHVAAVLEVSGTGYLYATPEMQAQISAAWASALNTSRASLQFFLLNRPIVWDLPGGFLDRLAEQVEWSEPTPWQRRRLELWEAAIAAREIETHFPVAELGQYLVVRSPLGDLETAGPAKDGIYLPPRRSWRPWERLPSILGSSRRERLARWRVRRDAAIAELSRVVGSIVNDVSRVPGPTGAMAVRPLAGLELTRLVHFLWRSDAAYGGPEWLNDEATLDAIVRGGDGEVTR